MSANPGLQKYEQKSFDQFPEKGRINCLLLAYDAGIGLGAGPYGT